MEMQSIKFNDLHLGTYVNVYTKSGVQILVLNSISELVKYI